MCFLLAPLLTFIGLAYWFNGIGGYDCLAFSTVMGASLSASNAMAFIHLFILSNSMHRANSRCQSVDNIDTFHRNGVLLYPPLSLSLNLKVQTRWVGGEFEVL